MMYAYNDFRMQKREKPSSLLKAYWVLFSTFFQIALLVVGGGLAMLPVVEQTFVRKHRWLTKDDTLDMIVITQTVPGLVAVNSAIYVGQKIAGVAGALCALIGVMIPSMVIITLIAMFFPNLDPKNETVLMVFDGVRACVTGMLVGMAWKLGGAVVSRQGDTLIILIMVLLLINGFHPLIIMAASLPLGWWYVYDEKKAQLGAKLKKMQEEVNYNDYHSYSSYNETESE